MNVGRGRTIAMMLGTMFLASGGVAAEVHASADTPETVKCSGINSCKGKGACHGVDHGCAGNNTCKGKGWIRVSPEECKKKGGKVLK